MTYGSLLKLFADYGPKETLALVGHLEHVAAQLHDKPEDVAGIMDFAEDAREACGNPDECVE